MAPILTVYLDSGGCVISAPPWPERVQGIAQPSQVLGRGLRDDVHIDGWQFNALQTPGEASEHQVIDLLGV